MRIFWRFGYFLALQLAGGALGWWLEGPWGAAAGAAVAAWFWFGGDLWRGARVLQWLRSGDLSAVPSIFGMWGEATDRARRLLRQHQAAGDEVLIITATNEFVTRPIAQALGVQQLLAMQLARDAQGWYTGEIDGIPTMREGKVRRMEQWLAERRLSWGDVESTFYSDSMNDVPLLEKVNHPVATNPDARLRALAHERGWRILDLFSDGTNQNAQPATAQDAAP